MTEDEIVIQWKVTDDKLTAAKRELSASKATIAELKHNLEKSMDEADAGLHREFLLERKIAKLTRLLHKVVEAFDKRSVLSGEFIYSIRSMLSKTK